MNQLEFTELMKLFSLFIVVVFVFGIFEEFVIWTHYCYKIAATCSIILMLWFFIHNAIIIYNNQKYETSLFSNIRIV